MYTKDDALDRYKFDLEQIKNRLYRLDISIKEDLKDMARDPAIYDEMLSLHYSQRHIERDAYNVCIAKIRILERG